MFRHTLSAYLSVSPVDPAAQETATMANKLSRPINEGARGRADTVSVYSGIGSIFSQSWKQLHFSHTEKKPKQTIWYMIILQSSAFNQNYVMHVYNNKLRHVHLKHFREEKRGFIGFRLVLSDEPQDIDKTSQLTYTNT